MAKRCLIVTLYFPPTGGGGVQRITKLIKYLSRQNWQFTVITSGEPLNYLPRDEKLLKEIPESVSVLKISHPQFKNNKKTSALFKSTFLKRWVSSFVFIPDRYKNWIKTAKEHILDLNKKENFDIILISSPPYSMALLAAELTGILHTPVILDMRDPWSANPYKIYPSRWHFKKDRQIEFETIKEIKYGITAYASLIEFYKKNIYLFKPENWKYISNGFDEDDFIALHPKNLAKDKLHIAFSGTFYSHINNPVILFKALAGLNSDLKEKIIFHHIGVANISISKMAKSFNLSNNLIEWGYHDHKECLNILAGMDAYCFILDSSHPNAANTIGGKVYEYLRLGKPVLALVPEKGEAAELIKKCNCGVVIDPHDTAAIKRQLVDWINEIPLPGTRQISPEYKRSNLAQKYADFFNKILLQAKK